MTDLVAAVAREVRAAVEAVKGTNARLFINDHWQAALDAGAYGIHVGQEDLDVIGQRDLETIRASGTRLGVSTHGYAEMVRAQRQPARCNVPISGARFSRTSGGQPATSSSSAWAIGCNRAADSRTFGSRIAKSGNEDATNPSRSVGFGVVTA